jgi:hypothetical protein
MSPSQVARKPIAPTKSQDVTITVDSSGKVAFNAGSANGDSAITSPSSSLFVKADGPFTGICARSGLILNPDGSVADEGACACASIVESGAAPHIATRQTAYTIRSTPAANDASYKVVPVQGNVESYGSVGDIRIGNGG